MDFLKCYYKHNIHICTYPSYTTYHLQPLNISMFTPLATYYSQELDNYIQVTQELCKMNKSQFYKLFKLAFEKAFSKKNFLSSWKQTRLYLLNLSLVLNQLSIKSEPLEVSQEDWPLSKNAGSHLLISLSDWRKINKVVKDTIYDVLGAEGQYLLNFYY